MFVTLTSSVRALPTPGLLSDVGNALTEFGQPYPPAVEGEPGINTSVRESWGPNGVTIVVGQYVRGDVVVRQKHAQPFVDGASLPLPEDAAFLDAVFAMRRDDHMIDYTTVHLTVVNDDLGLQVSVSAERELVETIRERLVEVLAAHRPPEQLSGVVAATTTVSGTVQSPFSVFVAYGGDKAWKTVTAYLDKNGVAWEAFSRKSRAGKVSLHVVDGMIRKSAMAIIVMTGPDVYGAKKLPRPNVLHEMGFAHGALGLDNVIVLYEKGVEMPSNYDGVNYIGFKSNEIGETEGEVMEIIAERKAAWERGEGA